MSLHLGDSPNEHGPLACSALVRRLSYKSVNPANKSTAKKKDAPAVKIAAQNRAASYNYELLDRFEAGMVLLGTEVKTLREGKGALRDAYAEIKGGEVWLMNCHIPEYRPGGPWNHGPLRARKLLLNRREINKLSGQVQQKGLTLIPLKIYFRDGMAKCELALARGKKFWDRRRAEREKEDKREAREAMHRYKRL
ncbi:MAG TPA: SsrA-binding protein SmpB [Candidatus Acidoferrales bacterium]|nr:SsrA-binding protein SmpB [Candidatus Acidoferrales bacterium]